MDDPRVVKTRLPLRVILTAVAIGLLLLAFIFFAVWQSGANIAEAKMTGTITAKEFRPAPEEQVTIQKGGAISARTVEGEYIVTVEVPMPDGTKKPYYVYVFDKQQYEALKIGDSYDVGPVLVK